jgi:hypothetical protein
VWTSSSKIHSKSEQLSTLALNNSQRPALKNGSA